MEENQQEIMLTRILQTNQFVILKSRSFSKENLKQYFILNHLQYSFTYIAPKKEESANDLDTVIAINQSVSQVKGIQEIHDLIIRPIFQKNKIFDYHTRELLLETFKILEKNGRWHIVLYPFENLVNKDTLLQILKEQSLNDKFKDVRFIVLTEKEDITYVYEPFTIHLLKETTNLNFMKPIYISYKHGDTSKNIIDNQLIPALNENAITYKIDQEDCLYMDHITQFEREIGNATKIIALINEKYLKSDECMYEMACIYENGSVNNRLFLLVNEDIRDKENIFNDIYEYWQNRKKQVITLKENQLTIEKVEKICNYFLPFLNDLKDCNTLSIAELARNNFAILLTKMGFKKEITINPKESNLISNASSPTTINVIGEHGQSYVFKDNASATIINNN